MAPDLGQLGEEVVAVEVDTKVVWVVWVLSEAVVVVMVWWMVMFLEKFVVTLESVVFLVVVVAVVVMELDVVERWQVVLLKCLMLVLSEGECCRANTLSLVSSVGVRGGGAVRGESGRVVGEAREECREVWCSVWGLGEWVRVGAGES